MYALIGKMVAKPGQRDARARLLLGGVQSMPGCRSYITAADPSDENAIWSTEVWDTEADHNVSLQLAEEQAPIREARPLIEGFGERFITTPPGGVGRG
jgi:quinol monooxygenase YgiN